MIPEGLAIQSDLNGTMNAAAVVAAFVGIAAGTVAIFIGIGHHGRSRVGWISIGIGCAGIAMIDLFVGAPAGVTYIVGASAWAGIILLLLLRQKPSNGTARRSVWFAAALVALNPLLDGGERAIMGNDQNYRFVQANQPYEMTEAAWHALALSRQIQESSELLAFVILLWILLSAAERESDSEEWT